MKNILNVEVSFFKNVKDNIPKTQNLYDFLRNTQYKTQSEKVMTSTKEEQLKKAKEQLPCITPSGLFSERGVSGLLKHSGLICLDIDFKDNSNVANFKDLKKLIIQIDCIAYCSLSASGKGFFVLIPIFSPEKHREHFKSLEIDFSNCGIKIDPACSDVSRLRFYAYDPEPYINLNAKTYNKIAAPIAVSKDLCSTLHENSLTSKEIERVEALINEIEDRLEDITGGYHQWFRIGCALANDFGEAGRDYFHRVSQYSDLYDFDAADRQFKECLKKPKGSSSIHINTLFHYAKQCGVILNGPEIDFAEVLSN